MRSTTLSQWLSTAPPPQQLIITDQTFCQFQLKQQLTKINLDGPPPLCLTYYQWLYYLIEHHEHRPAAILHALPAFYKFNCAAKAPRTISQRQYDFKRYQYLSRYQALPHQTDWPGHATDDLYLDQLSIYHKQCLTEQTMDSAQLFNWLLAQPPTRHWSHVLLATAAPLSPAEMKLLKMHCRQQDKLLGQSLPGALNHCSYANPTQEQHATILAVTQCMQRNPSQKLAIVTPNYQQNRALYTQIVSYSEQHQMHLAEQIILSAPKPLADYPIINTAIALFEQFFQAQIHLPFWTTHLRLHHLIADPTQNLHESTVYALSKINHIDCRWSLLNQSPTTELQPFMQRLKACKTMIDQISPKASLSTWAVCFEKILKYWLWPGPYALNSEQHQLIKAWQQCWAQWLMLEDSCQLCSGEQALLWLKINASNTKFQHQPENHNTTLSIVGYNELVSGQYDQLWALGIDEHQWPPATKSYHAIPATVTLATKIPTPNSPTQAAHQQHTFAILNHAAGQVHSSHSRTVAQATRLISPWLACSNPPQHQTEVAHLYQTDIDHKIPTTIDQSRLTPKKMSANLLKDYSSCTFKGMAIHCLHARTIEPMCSGLTPRWRGIIIHACLAKVWAQLKSQDQLLSLSADAQQLLVKHVVNQVIEPMKIRVDWPLSTAHTQVEIAIITKRITAWLKLEASRPNFCVEHIEHALTIAIEQHPFNLRVDRIDTTDSGLAIIDYKTGQANISDWMTMRPENPQMILYLMAYHPKATTLAYAHITARKLGFSGLSAQPSNWLGIKQVTDDQNGSWDQLLIFWENSIKCLIQSTQNSPALLNPKQDTITCRRCHLQSLCRINEMESHHATSG